MDRGVAQLIPFAHLGANTKIPSRSRFVGPERIWLGDGIFMEENIAFDTANLLFNEHPDPIRIRIGSRTTIGRNSQISAANRVEIGNNVLFAQNVYVADNDHHYSDVGVPIRDQYFSGYRGHVVVQDDCWLGRNSVLIGSGRGITVGQGSVVGANAVVTFDVPPYAVVAGNPGQVVKLYDPEVDEFVRIRDEGHRACVMSNRERLGMHKRAVRVDLAHFHHLLPPLPIEGLRSVNVGVELDPLNSSPAWLKACLQGVLPDERLALVVAVVKDGAWERLIEEVADCYSATFGATAGPNIIIQPIEEDERPCFLRSLTALLVDASSAGAERQCLESMACGVPVLAAAGGPVSRWLVDGTTGFVGDELGALLRRTLDQFPTLSDLGCNARALVERAFGVPHVAVDTQGFYYTTPSERLGL